jgi:transcriptional regulator with XRE-family HTH domain
MSLRAWRDRIGMTQEELAARIGVERSVYSRLERNERRITMGTFARLADALQLTDDERLAALRACEPHEVAA